MSRPPDENVARKEALVVANAEIDARATSQIVRKKLTVERNQLGFPQYRIGNVTHPWTFESRCKVCRAGGFRYNIEEAAVMGMRPADIANALPKEVGEPITGRNIIAHFKKHFPLDHIRPMLWEDAAKRGVLNEGPDPILTHQLVLQTIMQRGFEQMELDGSKVSIDQTIKSASELAKIEALIGEKISVQDYQDALMVYMQILSEMESPEFLEAFANRVDRNPIIVAMKARAAKKDQTAYVANSSDTDDDDDEDTPYVAPTGEPETHHSIEEEPEHQAIEAPNPDTDAEVFESPTRSRSSIMDEEQTGYRYEC